MIPTPVYIPQASNHTHAAQHRLFLPNRLFRSAGAQALTPEDSPVSPREGSQFPFNNPPGLASPSAEQAFTGRDVRCIPLFAAPLSTKNSQSASVASTVEALDVNSRLRFVKRSKTLWQNLKRYVDDQSGGVNGCTTWYWSRSGHIPLPDARDQATAVYGLAGWYTAHVNRGRAIVVNSEPAVQDEVQSQLLVPLDLMIKSRYKNNAGKPLEDNQHIWRSRSGRKLDDPPTGVFLPKWSRATHAAHPARGEAKRRAAGFPDYMITRSGNKLDNGASIEVKFFRSIASTVFHEFFSEYVIDSLTNFEFCWNESDTAVKVLKQIWGQVHFFSSKWGAITNGRLVCAYVKTGPNELTLSEIQEWEQDDVLQALTGLSFASIDDGFLPNAGLVEILCPVQGRDTDWYPADASYEQQARQPRWRIPPQVPQRTNPSQHLTMDPPVRFDTTNPQSYYAPQATRPYDQAQQAGWAPSPGHAQAQAQITPAVSAQWPAGHQPSQHASAGPVPGPSNLSRRQGESKGRRR